jgi:hypothetical protein
MQRFVALLLCGLVACGGSYKSGARVLGSPAPQAATAAAGVSVAGSATGGPAVATQIPEALVIEGSISLEVEEINDIVPALRAQVEAAGGRVINENVSGAETSWSAQLKLRLPPGKVEDVAAFLAKRGVITSKNISSTDVSKQLFDQDLAIKNLRTTLDRLTLLMATGGLQVQQILQIEQEMTRIRGQIDQLEGDQRFLKDRVALATLDVYISRRYGAVTIARAKAYPGVRGVMLTLFDPGSRARTRFGAGFVVHSVLRTMSMEVDVFQKQQNEAGDRSRASVLATLGGAGYSDFLGSGRRKNFNPYLGGRLGYGYLDGHKLVLQGEAGVELYKAKYFVLDANLRVSGLIGSQTNLALVTGLGAVVAF